jgi:hypothetical protein
MSESFTPPPDSRTTKSHETTDANPLAIASFGAALAILIAAVLPFLAWVYGRMETTARHSDVKASKTIVATRLSGPKLQSQPAIDLQQLRESESLRLNAYQWIDQDQGTVRIPVRRAMDILAERGFPERKQAVLPVENP